MYGPSIKRRVSLCSSPGPASSGSTSTCRLVVGTADAVAGAAVGARRGGEADDREEDEGAHRDGVTSKGLMNGANRLARQSFVGRENSVAPDSLRTIEWIGKSVPLAVAVLRSSMQHSTVSRYHTEPYLSTS